MFRIEVTQDDIDHGVRFNCFECPAHRAIWRSLELDAGCPEGTWLGVGSKIVLHHDRQSLEIPTPPVLGEWINDFDSLGRHAVSPITVEMDLSPFWSLLYEEAVPC